MRSVLLSIFLLLTIGLMACQAVPTPAPVVAIATPGATATAGGAGSDEAVAVPTLTPTLRPTFTPAATQTPVPTPTALPTATLLPTATPVPDIYYVKAGDTLLGLAQRFGCSPEDILRLNPALVGELKIGDFLRVPAAITVNLPQAFLVPDSEVVYGPAYLGWDTQAYIQSKGGYLAQYREQDKTAGAILDEIAARYHVGPRVLLALIELESGWLTQTAPANPYAFGLQDPGRPRLSQQALWAAMTILDGYYGQLEGRRDWVTLENGVRARLASNTNAGSAGVVNLLARVVKPADTFPGFMQSNIFAQTYYRLFGEIEGGRVMPPDGVQPYLAMPWTNEDPWYFTGGPHGGYGDTYSGWGALDLAPPLPSGCYRSIYSVRSMSRGLVIATGDGEVWVDMDMDGDVRTGWVLFYLHMDTYGRVATGTTVEVGDMIGYPSCEGGVTNASHLHLSRMYHGQWMPAQGPVPFQLGNWVASAVIGESYSGYLTNYATGRIMTACACRSIRLNRFPHEPRQAEQARNGR